MHFKGIRWSGKWHKYSIYLCFFAAYEDEKNCYMPFPKIRLEIEKYTWRINGWGNKMIDCQSTEAISINGTGWSSWATNAEFFYFVPSPVLPWSRAHVHIHYATKCLIMQRWWYVGRPSRKRINMLCNANEEQQLSLGHLVRPRLHNAAAVTLTSIDGFCQHLIR